MPDRLEAEVDMIAAGASDTACMLYPDKGQAKERAAFVAGVAHQAMNQALARRDGGEGER